MIDLIRIWGWASLFLVGVGFLTYLSLVFVEEE